jgi:uncharacterized protein
MNEPWLQTWTGKKFFPQNPRIDDILIEDIARGLAMNCRFAGQVITFFSVAEHSILCSEVAPDNLKCAALLHDASESYIADLGKHLKPHLGGYREIEARLMAAIGERFGVTPEEFQAIKPIDERMLMTEAWALLPGGPLGSEWPDVRPFEEVTLLFLNPFEAEQLFLRRFLEVSTSRGKE